MTWQVVYLNIFRQSEDAIYFKKGGIISNVCYSRQIYDSMKTFSRLGITTIKNKFATLATDTLLYVRIDFGSII